MPSKARSFQLPALDIPASSLTAGTSIPAPPPSPPQRKSPPRAWPDPASPQTPLRTDQPNPLRSHPTSSHSLSRKFTAEGQLEQPPPATERREPGVNRPRAAAAAAAPPKRTGARDGDGPPPAKRPLSVRRFLGLRSLSRSGADPRGSGAGAAHAYAAGGPAGRSSDKLSVLGAQGRPGTAASNSPTSPSLRKRSSLMLFARRSSNFLGLTVEEEEELGVSRDSQDSVAADKKRTPPPSLPRLDGLKASRGLHDQQGGYLGGGDMFRNIG